MNNDYETLDDLPASLKKELPRDAQEIYLAAYRRNWEKCGMGGDVAEEALAEKAHDAAMLAVESEFERDERGGWQRSSAGDSVDTAKLRAADPQ